MGPRRSSLSGVAARAAAIGLLALACPPGATAAAARGRREDGAAAPAAGELLPGNRQEGRVSSPRERGRERERERAAAPSLLLQEELFAGQALFERQDEELLRQQNSLWARDSGEGSAEAGAGAKAGQGDDYIAPPSLEVVAAAAAGAAGELGSSKPFESSKGTAVEGGGSLDLQEDGGQADGGGGGGHGYGYGDGIAAAVAGIATSVLAALAAAAGAGADATAALADESKASLFAPDDDSSYADEGGPWLLWGAGRGGGLRGGDSAANGGSSAGRDVGVGGDVARGDAEAGVGSAGRSVRRALQVTLEGVEVRSMRCCRVSFSGFISTISDDYAEMLCSANLTSLGKI